MELNVYSIVTISQAPEKYKGKSQYWKLSLSKSPYTKWYDTPSNPLCHQGARIQETRTVTPTPQAINWRIPLWRNRWIAGQKPKHSDSKQVFQRYDWPHPINLQRNPLINKQHSGVSNQCFSSSLLSIKCTTEDRDF